jgi:hypothetical protein
LHGLLALGSISELNEGANVASAQAASERQAVLTYDFARSDIVDPALDLSRVQRRPDMHRLSNKHHSKSMSADTTDRSTPGPSPSFRSPLGRADATQVSQTRLSNSQIPTWTPSDQVIAIDQSLELLKFYRYHIAPWVRRIRSS